MGILEKMKLDGKKGFVTGGARGIGKCTATAFAEAGADVAIVDLDGDEARKTALELAERTGRKVIAIRTDCTKKDQVDAMVDQVVAQLGGLHFCHNNAGICINAPAEEMTWDQWYKVINKVLERHVDMVVGDRLSSTYFTENKRPFHNVGNTMTRFAVNRIYRSDVRDIMTGLPRDAGALVLPAGGFAWLLHEYK